jgi:hypothetical protein
VGTIDGSGDGQFNRAPLPIAAIVVPRSMWIFGAEKIAVEAGATGHREMAASCCTCALAMLAKPRF